jgi:hypothetical protein
MDVTVLQHGRGISKDKIYGACHQAAHVKLAVGVHVKAVLVCKHIATVKCREVCPDPESYGLVL